MSETKFQIDPLYSDGAYANFIAAIKSLLAKTMALGPAATATTYCQAEVNKAVEYLQNALAGMGSSLPVVPVREVNMSATRIGPAIDSPRGALHDNLATQEAMEMMQKA
jgi:hypothetical protein